MPATASCQGVASRHHGADSLTPRFLPPFEWRSRTLRQIKTGSTHFPKPGRRLLFTIVEILWRISSSRFPHVNWTMLFYKSLLMDFIGSGGFRSWFRILLEIFIESFERILYFWSIFVFLEIQEGSKSYHSIFYMCFI